MPTCQCKEGFYKFLEEGQERGQLEMAGCRKPSNEEIGDNVCNEFQELKCDFVSGGIKPCECLDNNECNSDPCDQETQTCNNKESSGYECVCKETHEPSKNDANICVLKKSPVDLCIENNSCASENDDQTCKLDPNNENQYICESKCVDNKIFGCGHIENSVCVELNDEFKCMCKLGFTMSVKEKKCGKIQEEDEEENDDDSDDNDNILVVPEVNSVTETNNNDNNNNNKDDKNKPNPESDDPDTQNHVVSSSENKSLSEASSSNKTLFIVGVCIIIIVVIGILLWLRNRKEAGEERENQALNSNN